MRCLTYLCGAAVDINRQWKSNQYCRFTKAQCPECKMKYWIVFRRGRFSIIDRISEKFDNRRSPRETKRANRKQINTQI